MLQVRKKYSSITAYFNVLLVLVRKIFYCTVNAICNKYLGCSLYTIPQYICRAPIIIIVTLRYRIVN